MLIKVKKTKTDYDNRVLAERTTRKHIDVLKGFSKAKGAQRGDYKMCRQLDKTLIDYHKFKNKTDREKIKNEYFGIQREERNRAYERGEFGGEYAKKEKSKEEG